MMNFTQEKMRPSQQTLFTIKQIAYSYQPLSRGDEQTETYWS